MSARPSVFVFALLIALSVPFPRTVLLRHPWMSYRTGLGPSVISVPVRVGVFILLALFSIWPILHGGAADPRFGGASSAYGAGIGLVVAEAVLVRRIEADPRMREQLEG